MGNSRKDYSDYIRFYLITEDSPAFLVENVIGWNEFGLDSARNMEYHGTLNKVTKTLGFTKQARSFILDEYNKNDVLGNLTLLVERLTSNDNNEVVWVYDEPVFADFYTIEPNEDVLTISFNSNNLMNLIDAYESEEFQIERLEDISKNEIPYITTRKVDLLGRSLLSLGESKVKEGYFENVNGNQETFTEDYAGSAADWNPITDFVHQGPDRHSTTDVKDGVLTASRMLYVNSTTEDNINEISIDYLIIGNASITSSELGTHLIAINKYSYNEDTATYTLLDSYPLMISTANNLGFSILNIQGVYTTDLKYNESIAVVFAKEIRVKFTVYRMKVSEVARFEPSYDIEFHLVSDVINRLLLIITGKDNLLKSSIFKLRDNENEEDGKYALISMLSGMQARGYDKNDDNYKPLTTSLKDVLNSISSVFNLGYGIENINNKEFLVIEELDYFYRNEVISVFNSKINNVERYVDSSHYYSGLELGYENSGEYSNRIGLDEPNVKVNYVTPINNIENKFKKVSSIRADENGLEIIRRKKYENFSSETVNNEEQIWFLDLKRSEELDKDFEQVNWDDRLSELPTGIHSPETFRSMIFSPSVVLNRLSNNFNSGIYKHKNKYIVFSDSNSNSNLSVDFINKNIEFQERQDIVVSDLKRPIFQNKVIKFTHPYSESLREFLFGKTLVLINGEQRLVPNFCFKFKWINEFDKEEFGYFLKYEYEDNPTFEFQLSNEEII